MKRTFFLLLFIVSVSQVFAQLYRNEWIDYSKPHYKFKVNFGIDPVTVQPIKNKLVRIPFATLQAAGLGNVVAEDFKLFRNGVEVPIYTSVAAGLLSATDYIEFWGEINDGKPDKDLYRDPEFQLTDIWSLQEDAGTYFLTTHTGVNKRLVTTANNANTATIDPTLYFMNTVNYTQRQRRHEGFAAQAALPLYSSSYDRGEGYTTRPIRPIGSPCGQVSFTITFPNLKPYLAGPPMRMKVHTVGNANNARRILVRLNGTDVAFYQMDYFFDAKIEEFGLPVSLVASGTANFQHINQSAVGCDEFRLAYNELTYPRTLDVNNLPALPLTLPASSQGHLLKFYGYGTFTNTPVLYDLTNGKRYIADVSVSDTLRFLTEPSTTASNLVLVNVDAANIHTVTNLQERNFVNYNIASNQGDYLIISNALLYGSGNYVEQYRAYRASANGGGYNAKIVDIDQLEDQFAYGINKHPISIRNFLRYARANFLTTPKHVFIIGKGLNYLEFRNNENQADIAVQNLVPTWGHPASDNLLSANDNTNPTPLTPIGRLSVVSPSEINDYLQKVKQYDSVQRSTSYTVEDKAWMKNVLHVTGANDISIGAQLDGYMVKYKQIISDTFFGANARNFDKLADPSAYSQSLRDFKNLLESGSSLITYFGHSSSTSLDFNLDNPSEYDNKFKYPIFIANGCDAGNFYVYQPQRLSQKTTISEKFTLAPKSGAIAYVATTNYGVVNYLDTFTTKFYRAFSNSFYNQPIGKVISAGIQDVLNNTNTTDFFARFHAEQYTLHGDPALKLNTYEYPDYAVQSNTVTITPQRITTAQDSFTVKAVLYNLGKKINDSVQVKITRQYPSGNSEIVFNQLIKAIGVKDSIEIRLPIMPLRDKGLNQITVTIDENNVITEITKANNTITLNVDITDQDIIPVYPYNYAIVNTNNFKLAASTANPFDVMKMYEVEIDTTAKFNSPFKVTLNKLSVGGVVEFDHGLTLQNNTTYYWRVHEQGSGYWNTASFTYKNLPDVGFRQNHYYQHLNSSYQQMFLDTTNRTFKFGKKANNLFIIHSIYPTSGQNDQDFSIQVNGTGSIASACLGSSVIINVFDTINFRPWENLTNPFGATPTCDVLRKYNFEYDYTTQAGRNNARQFLQSIPNGYLVAVRLVYDFVPVFADQWADDSTTYGINNTLYGILKKEGLPIDSFNSNRNFAFVFKKNDSANFSPKYAFSNGVYERIIMNVDFDTKDTVGFVTSPKFGPAKAWKNVKWNGVGNANSFTQLRVLGVNAAGEKMLLHQLDTLQTSFDISSVSTTDYPYIQLQMRTQDSLLAVAYQLKNWSVEYDGVAEGAMAPNLFVNLPDSAGAGTLAMNDTLKGAIAFKNVSKINFTDSLPVKLVLTNNRLGNVYTYNLHKLKPILAEDTVHVNFAINIALLPQDEYTLYLVVNEQQTLKEQFLFNNYIFKNIYLKTNLIVPVKLLNFAATPKQNKVELSWEVAEQQEVRKYLVEHSTTGRDFTAIGGLNVGLHTQYLLMHENPATGKNYYRLKIVNADGSYLYSQTRLVMFDKTPIVKIYPNPVVDYVQITFTKDNTSPVTLKLYSSSGALVTVKQFSGNIHLQLSSLPSGTYIVQLDDGFNKTNHTLIKK
jgi:hypothetical protein